MNLQATAELLGNFGEFFGSIAVVATLMYLAKGLLVLLKLTLPWELGN